MNWYSFPGLETGAEKTPFSLLLEESEDLEELDEDDEWSDELSVELSELESRIFSVSLFSCYTVGSRNEVKNKVRPDKIG